MLVHCGIAEPSTENDAVIQRLGGRSDMSRRVTVIDHALLIGTWKLVETRAHDNDGNILPSPYGGIGSGLVNFDLAGRMVAVLCQGGDVPEGNQREYNSYCGTYTFDGAILITRVDATAEPAWMGSDQVRHVSMEGSRMVLCPPPRPWRGLMQHRQLVWEKIG